jgi:hypothetical protein
MEHVAPFNLQGKALQFLSVSTFVPVLTIAFPILLSSVFMLVISLLVRYPFLYQFYINFSYFQSKSYSFKKIAKKMIKKSYSASRVKQFRK